MTTNNIEALADPFGMGAAAIRSSKALTKSDLNRLRAICASIRDAAMVAAVHKPERMHEYVWAAGYAEGVILGVHDADDDL